jgi:hypothetical protein
MGAIADVITGSKAIADELGVHPRRVAGLYRAGAPIKRLGEGRGVRYLASKAALRFWLASSSVNLVHLEASNGI